MKAAIQGLREIIRWRLHSLSDSAFEVCMRCDRQGRAGGFWLWIAGRLDRLAIWIGRPFTGPLHK